MLISKQTAKALFIASLLVISIWLFYGIHKLFLSGQCIGVLPLSVQGLPGILLSPLQHGDLSHLISNTTPLFFSCFLLFQFHSRLASYVLVLGWWLSGTLLWTIGGIGIAQPYITACHIGASTIIYLLLSYLFFSGLFRREPVSILLSILVLSLYGGLAYFILPMHFFNDNVPSNLSWQGHLAGALIGLLLAYLFRSFARVTTLSNT
ncbi:rhomboid family intramembrane serine protease [Pseudomonas sp. F1_0610]|uniref:rhomboid family intramembrane serine protease n=1 Tax=Pseudomonas sp. F1_0610 TaxID=3114284 RepID=UPI0039C3FE89